VSGNSGFNRNHLPTAIAAHPGNQAMAGLVISPFPIEARTVPSTVIKRYSYDAERKELRITFQSGKLYTYHNVPEDIVTEFNCAFSKGEFFSSHIRDRFAFRRQGVSAIR
jgi:hypothetical protein